MEKLVEIPVEPFDNKIPDTPDVQLVIFDAQYLTIDEDHHRLHEHTLVWKRPDWAGTILEMIKYGNRRYLYCRYWYSLHYLPLTAQVEFVRCDTPKIYAEHVVLYLERSLMSWSTSQALRDVLKPHKLAQDIANRLLCAKIIDKNEKKTWINNGFHDDICLELEQLVLELKKQRDEWKDRFFFNGMFTEECTNPYALCNNCKEAMRIAYYESTEKDALNWRPGKGYNDACWSSNCKGFCLYSFPSEEDPDQLDYAKHTPVDV